MEHQMLRKIVFFGSLLYSFAFTPAASAAAVDCVGLKPDTTIKIELRSSNDFLNCFRLDELSSGKSIEIYSMSEGDIESSLSIYEIDAGSAQRIARVHSDGRGIAAYQSSISANTMGFRVNPTTQPNKNKNLAVSYILTPDGEVMVFVELEPVGKEA
ncbi:hypothetical protein ACR0ST_03420 [Aliidiomarina sp. Khilg15.8]